MRFIALAALVLTAAIIVGSPAPAEPVALADVPMTMVNGHAFVDVSESGHIAHLILDTGTEYHSISIDFARSVGLELKPGRNEGYFETTFHALKIGNFTTSPTRTVAGPDMGKYGQLLGERIDGVLSYNAFKGAILQLDYRNNRLRIFADTPNLRPGVITQPLTIRRYNSTFEEVPVFTGLTVNGQSVSAEFDTLSPEPLVLLDNTQHLIAPLDPPQTVALDTWAHAPQVNRAAHATVVFGTLALTGGSDNVYYVGERHRKPDPGLDATAGNGLWANTVVTLDFKHGTISV